MKLDPMQRSRDFTAGQHPRRGHKSTQQRLAEIDTRLTTAFDAFGGGGGGGGGNLVLDDLPDPDAQYIGTPVVVRTPAGQPSAVYVGGQDAFDNPVWVPQASGDPASWTYHSSFGPDDVAIRNVAASPRYVYVSEEAEDRVHLYTLGGAFVSTVDPASSFSLIYGMHYDPVNDRIGIVGGGDAVSEGVRVFSADLSSLVFEHDTIGSGNGEFEGPADLTTDIDGNWYVVDQTNNRIQKFNSSGTYVTQWGSLGSGEGEFRLARGIAADPEGNLHVVDSNNYRVQKFSSAGTFLLAYGSRGGGPAQFSLPTYITCTDDGYLVVTDSNARRMTVWNINGEYITGIPTDKIADQQWYATSSADYRGNLYVVDHDSSTVGHQGTVRRFRASGATGSAIVVAKGSEIVSGGARILDFSGKFLVTESPEGEANIDLDYGTVAVGLNGSLVAADASVLDFSSAFTVTESPAGEANIGLAAFSPASSAGAAYQQFHEDTDNGSNYVAITAPASVTANRTQTLPDASGTLALVEDADALVQTVHASISHNSSTNSSTVTYATHLSTTKVLPAGTWACMVHMVATYSGNTGANSDAQSRIGSPMTGTTYNAAGVATGRYIIAPTANGTVVSDGSTATTFTGEYRRGSGDTIRADAASLTAICVRTA